MPQRHAAAKASASESSTQRTAQLAALRKLPARDLAHGFLFAWDYLSAIETNPDRSFEEQYVATQTLNAIAGRLNTGY